MKQFLLRIFAHQARLRELYSRQHNKSANHAHCRRIAQVGPFKPVADCFLFSRNQLIPRLTELPLLAKILLVVQIIMQATCQKMVEIMEGALDVFFANEIPVVLSGVSERSSCARMALYLQKSADENGYSQYYADTEYNRMHNHKIKTIIDDKDVKIRVTCDLLLHGRGMCGSQENLIAVEMKKDGRPESHYTKDRHRLIALTKDPSPSANIVWNVDGPPRWPEHVCGYILGVFVILDRTRNTCTIEYYRSGSMVNSNMRKF